MLFWLILGIWAKTFVLASFWNLTLKVEFSLKRKRPALIIRFRLRTDGNPLYTSWNHRHASRARKTSPSIWHRWASFKNYSCNQPNLKSNHRRRQQHHHQRYRRLNQRPWTVSNKKIQVSHLSCSVVHLSHLYCVKCGGRFTVLLLPKPCPLPAGWPHPTPTFLVHAARTILVFIRTRTTPSKPKETFMRASIIAHQPQQPNQSTFVTFFVLWFSLLWWSCLCGNGSKQFERIRWHSTINHDACFSTCLWVMFWYLWTASFCNHECVLPVVCVCIFSNCWKSQWYAIWRSWY